MVCPNCHSDEVIQVQDQHFCISCGQMVPEPKVEPVLAAAGSVAAATKRAAKVQANGLPEGVTILPLAPLKAKAEVKAEAVVPAAETAAAPEAPEAPASDVSTEAAAPVKDMEPAPVTSSAPVAPVTPAKAAPPLEIPADAAPLIVKRSRIQIPDDDDTEAGPEPAPAAAKPAPSAAAEAKSADAKSDAKPAAKRRKAGRPKAGRLDIPRPVAGAAANAAAAASVTAPAVNQTVADSSIRPMPARSMAPRSPLPVVAPPIGGRRMSDIAPRRPAAQTEPVPAEIAKSAAIVEKPAKPAKRAKRPKSSHHHSHVPPLHYGPVVAFALRSRAQAHHLALAAFGAVSLGVAGAYGAWAAMHGGLAVLAADVAHAGPKLITEAVLLALIYYVGRSLGQTAIVYGIARESDQRPVPLSRQIGVGINTFGRRLRLDLGFGLAEGTLIAVAVLLFLAGGQNWPIPPSAQVAAIFGSFLVILYVLTALALSRGLAGVALTLTNLGPATTAKLGWQLFSHRFELVGPRVGALIMEAVLMLPLMALAVALVIVTPPAFAVLAAIGAGILAWLAGAMFGVGTAAWWAMLYRQLVLADRPAAAVALLSSRHPEDARRAPLAAIVALVTLLVAATLVLPWFSAL